MQELASAEEGRLARTTRTRPQRMLASSTSGVEMPGRSRCATGARLVSNRLLPLLSRGHEGTYLRVAGDRPGGARRRFRHALRVQAADGDREDPGELQAGDVARRSGNVDHGADLQERDLLG